MSKARPITREGMKSPNMTDEEKMIRGRRRQRIANLNAIIKAGGTVIVEVAPPPDKPFDDPIDIEVLSISLCPDYQQVKIGHVPFSDQDKPKNERGLTCTIVSLNTHTFEVSI